jgi:hypothetical protein
MSKREPVPQDLGESTETDLVTAFAALRLSGAPSSGLYYSFLEW